MVFKKKRAEIARRAEQDQEESNAIETG